MPQYVYTAFRTDCYVRKLSSALGGTKPRTQVHLPSGLAAAEDAEDAAEQAIKDAEEAKRGAEAKRREDEYRVHVHAAGCSSLHTLAVDKHITVRELKARIAAHWTLGSGAGPGAPGPGDATEHVRLRVLDTTRNVASLWGIWASVLQPVWKYGGHTEDNGHKR